MSRADWGADETISGWSHGDVQTFAPDQVVTVHHIAGSNDLSQDYAATVRAIYVYHVQSTGWSDIGYQYLIDGNGVVYEGRNSGHTRRSCLNGGHDGWDFAHDSRTDDVVTGAHTLNYNVGNIGIALMGCYEPGNACSGETTPPAPAVTSLEHRLAALAVRHGLTPTGTTVYSNPVNGYQKTNPTVSGHRDWDATACPGGNLYAQLPSIRTAAADLMASTPVAVSTTSAPGAPRGFTATATGQTVTLSWSSPVSDGGQPITSYTVYRSNGSGVSTSDHQVSSGSDVTVTDTPGPGSWYYAVRACNDVGCSYLAVTGPVSTVVATITSASCRGATCTFAGTGYGTLTWDLGNRTAAGSPVKTTYKSPGTYAVTLTDAGSTSASTTVGCTGKKSVSCTVTAPVG